MMTRCDTESMNFFLEKLSEQYTDDYILLICDGAAWHKSTELIIPENIELFFIPPYTPEMNPIEQIWKEIRKRGFQNEVFDSLEAVIDRLCFTIKNLPATVIKSITGRKWILSIFQTRNSINRLITSGTLGMNDLDIAIAIRDDLQYAVDLFK